MNKYEFSIGEVPCQLSFWVTEQTPEAAVIKANATLGEMNEGSRIYIGLGIYSAHVVVDERTRVTIEHITATRPVSAPPESALQLLYDKGYENSGRDIVKWREILTEDTDLRWVKGFVTGTGWNAAGYGMLFVKVDQLAGEEGWNFRFSAHIYMGRTQQGLSGERGGIGYSVDLEDRQWHIGVAKFPEALEAYEKKFSELVYVLREADPVDGYPLSEMEQVTGEIQGFMEH